MTFYAQNLTDFTGPYDISCFRDMHLEAWRRDTPELPWLRLIRDPNLRFDVGEVFDDQTIAFDNYDSTDHLYHEKVRKIYHPIIKHKIFFREEGQDADLGKLGIIEGRPAIAKFSVFELESKGIAARSIGPGDIIVYRTRNFQISQIMPDPESLWLTSAQPFILIAALNVVDRISQ